MLDDGRFDYGAGCNLHEVILPGGTHIEYLIDGRNRRVGKKVEGELQRRWIYRDQLSPVAQFDGDGNMTHRFVYAEKFHAPSYMVKIDPATGEETEYRIVSDHLGSVRQVIDAETGAIVQEMEYGPFGQVIADTNPGFQPYGFAGGVYDRDTGLVRFGARDYEPETGRWTTKDPIGFAAGDTGLYNYIFNDPLNLVDPFGLQVYVCRDNSRISGGVGGPLIKHYWLETNTYSSGMGTQEQGVESGNEYEWWNSETETVNHGGRSSRPGAECRLVDTADESIVDELIRPGQPTGPFRPPYNYCESFVRDVLTEAGGEFPFDDWAKMKIPHLNPP